MLDGIIKYLAKSHPDIIPFLKGRALWIAASQQEAEYKSYEYMLSQVEKIIRDAYSGKLGTNDFASSMSSLISANVRNAYNTAWADAEYGGGTSPYLPDYLESSLQSFIGTAADMQFSYSLYSDIMAARRDKIPVENLLSRAPMWAARWNDAYNTAERLINAKLGERMQWIEGGTKDKCKVCVSLNGIVAFASVWEDLGVHPGDAPNDKITCGGWNCACRLQQTKRRQSPNARAAIIRALRAR
jgi:hypothetical protein